MKLTVIAPRCVRFSRLCCVTVILWIAVFLNDNAFAQKSPLTLPFRINVSISGSYSEFNEYDTSTRPIYDMIGSKVVQAFVIDSTAMGSSIVIAGDSLVYFDTTNTSDPLGWYSSRAIFHFDTVRKIITSMSLALNEYYVNLYDLNTTLYYSWGLSCLNVPYENDSIPTLDSIPSSDVLRVYYDSSGIIRPDIPPLGRWDSASSKLVSGQVRLSGSNIPALSVNEYSPSIGFNAVSENGLLKCTFAPSNHARILEMYSTIGAEIQRISIPPSENFIVVPNLTAGLYFLRLENNFLRVYTPN